MKYYQLKINDTFVHEGVAFKVLKSEQYCCPSSKAMCNRGYDCVCDDLWFVKARAVTYGTIKTFKLDMWADYQYTTVKEATS